MTPTSISSPVLHFSFDYAAHSVFIVSTLKASHRIIGAWVPLSLFFQICIQHPEESNLHISDERSAMGTPCLKGNSGNGFLS